MRYEDCGIPVFEAFAKYQQPDGQVIFHRGEFEEDDNTDKWCSQMFFNYLMLYANNKKLSKRIGRKGIARIATVPCYLVGFNIDSFDTKSILQRFTDMDWPNGFFPYIVPNSGTAITQLQICANETFTAKDGEQRTVKTLSL